MHIILWIRPVHYLSSSGLRWDAMLKMTDFKLDLISDIGMHQFIGKGVKGGASFVSERYSNANNKYVKSYDKSEPSKFIA